MSPEDSSGLPGSHSSASASPLASPAGTEEAADLRVRAAVARERAQHVSCGAAGLTYHSCAAWLSLLTALAAGHSTHSLQRCQPLLFLVAHMQVHLLQAEEKAAMLADFQASYTALAAKQQRQLQSAQAALAATFEQRLLAAQAAMSASFEQRLVEAQAQHAAEVADLDAQVTMLQAALRDTYSY